MEPSGSLPSYTIPRTPHQNDILEQVEGSLDEILGVFVVIQLIIIERRGRVVNTRASYLKGPLLSKSFPLQH